MVLGGGVRRLLQGHGSLGIKGRRGAGIWPVFVMAHLRVRAGGRWNPERWLWAMNLMAVLLVSGACEGAVARAARCGGPGQGSGATLR